LVSGLFKVYDQDFCSFLDMFMLRSGAYSLMRSFCIGRTFVAPLCNSLTAKLLLALEEFEALIYIRKLMMSGR
jgi:hypothetical protein